jgi:hypothetical protein
MAGNLFALEAAQEFADTSAVLDSMSQLSLAVFLSLGLAPLLRKPEWYQHQA